MRIICNIFGHTWDYHVMSMDTPRKNFRCCKFCGDMQEYKTIHLPFSEENDWVTLTRRTKDGAKKFLETLTKK